MLSIRTGFSLFFVCLFLLIGFTAAATDYWPTNGWRTSTPEEQGVDSKQLANLLERIKTQGNRIDSVTVIRNGYAVLDAYFYPFERDLKHNIYSVTKSFTSTLVGIALDRGEIKSVARPVLDFFPDRVVANLDDRKRAMTLEHLLTMRTGFDCADSYRHRWKGLWKMLNSPDWTQHVLDLPMRETPGQSFDYCNGASFLLSSILQTATKMRTFDYAKKHLFAPLGITDVAWPETPSGVTVGYGQMWLNPHDMAKLGWLFLNNGMWDGRQIVSPTWIKRATRPQVRATLFASYGYQWWHSASDYYMAVGYAGQFIFVLPKKNMVVVFTSDLVSRDFYTPRNLLTEFVIPAARSETSLPANPEQQQRLRARVASAEQSRPYIFGVSEPRNGAHTGCKHRER